MIGRGRVELAWEDYRRLYRLERAPDWVNFRAQKRAFYAGFLAMLELLQAEVDPREPIGSGDVAKLVMLEEEIHRYRHSLEGWQG